MCHLFHTLFEIDIEKIDQINRNYVNLKKNRNDDSNGKINEFFSENINVDEVDYYYSNVIARASKTMSECRNNKLYLKKTGTDN